MRLPTVVSLLGLLTGQAVALYIVNYTQNASIAITGYEPYAVVEVPILDINILPATCTNFPWGVWNVTLLPIVTPNNTSYTCAVLGQPCAFDIGNVTPDSPSVSVRTSGYGLAASCWWPYNTSTGQTYPVG